MISGSPLTSTKYLDNPTFTFGCTAGSLQGTSESGDTTVKCKTNGRWSLNTLTCSGMYQLSSVPTCFVVYLNSKVAFIANIIDLDQAKGAV